MDISTRLLLSVESRTSGCHFPFSRKQCGCCPTGMKDSFRNSDKFDSLDWKLKSLLKENLKREPWGTPLHVYTCVFLLSIPPHSFDNGTPLYCGVLCSLVGKILPLSDKGVHWARLGQSEEFISCQKCLVKASAQEPSRELSFRLPGLLNL